MFGALSMHGVQQGLVRSRFRRAGLVERTVTLGEATVRYWEGGQGRPLLLLHGFGSDATWTWHANVRQLVQGRRLYVPDLLWFGESGSRRADFSLAYQAEVALALLDQAGVDGFDVVGISYGGLVAWLLAHLHPDRVGRLVLVDSPGPVFTREDQEAALARFGVDDLASIVLPKGPEDVRRLIELALYRPPPTPDFVLHYLYERMFTDRVEEKRQLLLHVQDDDLRAQARSWSVDRPTLLVWGEQDPLFPVEVAVRLQQSLPDASLVVLPASRHAPNLEEPRRFARAVQRFLRSTP